MLQIATGPEIVKWTGEQLKVPSFGLAEGLGICRDGKLIAGLVYSGFNGSDIQIDMASTDPRWCSRASLRVIFGYPFNQLGCRRVTFIVAASNQKSRRLVEGLGAKLEGFHPQALRTGEDAISYGMLKDDCKWIKPRGFNEAD